jgi:hypothetical protein
MVSADIAASLRRLVAHPTVEQHAQRGDEGERLVGSGDSGRSLGEWNRRGRRIAVIADANLW